jgi:hypothetical protein
MDFHAEQISTVEISITWTNFNYEQFHPLIISIFEQIWKCTKSHVEEFWTNVPPQTVPNLNKIPTFFPRLVTWTDIDDE